MRYNFNLIVAFLVFALFTNCGIADEKTDVSIISTIQFDEAKEFHLSDFVAEQKYILLSTDEAALFKRVDKLIAKNDHFYFFDHLSNSGVLVFDAEGNFIREVGEYGEGPQQLRGISDIQVGDNGEVMLLDRLKKSIVTYSSDGTWKTKVDLPLDAGGFALLGDKWFLAINYDHQNNELNNNPVVGIYDKSIELDSLYFHYSKGAENANVYYHAGTLSSGNNSMVYHRPPNDTISIFSSTGKLTERLAIDFGSKKLPIEVVDDFQTLREYKTQDASFNYLPSPALVVGNQVFGTISSTKNEIWTYVLNLDSKELFTYKVNLNELRLNEIILPTANLNDEIVVTLLDPTTFSQESNPEAYPENVREHLENEGSALLLHYLRP